jgi:hypothetical protein
MSYKNDFFSNTHPDLISTKSLTDLDKIIIGSNDAGQKTITSLTDSLIQFYKKYIQANVLPIVIIIIFLAFIIYRYMSKNEQFDPSKSISAQQNLLEQTDILNNKVRKENNLNIENIDEILDDESIYDNLNFKPVSDSNSREVYTGTNNRWAGSQDDEMEHPLGYENNFISTTADTIGAFASRNKETINLASKMIFN